MVQAFRTHWRCYLIEAWALGTFMISACLFTIVLYHVDSPVYARIPTEAVRRLLMGGAMGLTLIALVYSPWGKRSGAHMNPAITLANLQMERISVQNAIWYILAQFAGGLTGVMLLQLLIPDLISSPYVNHAVTVPGMWGFGIALISEFCLSFLMLMAVLVVSNSSISRYTGYIAGMLLTLFIAFESPVSGMSLNPARTFASAFPSGVWTGWWIYFTAPLAGMMLAGFAYRKGYRRMHDGHCLTMKCHMSGEDDKAETYEVLGPVDALHKIGTDHNLDSGKDRTLLPL